MNDIVQTDNKNSLSMSPEHIEVANAYIQLGDKKTVAENLNIRLSDVSEILEKREVKKYVDSVFFDAGYRNRDKFFSLLDNIIEKKIEEAEEADFWSKKDLMEILTMVHKMKMDEQKLSRDDRKDAPSVQTNIQINDGFGEGNYGKLMSALLKPKE